MKEKEKGEDSSSDEEAKEPHSSIAQCHINPLTEAMSKNLSEAMSSTEDIASDKFLDLQDLITEATEACQLLDRLTNLLQKQLLKQTTV